LPIRFLADANLDHDIVAGVLRRKPQIDFEAGILPDGMKDPEVLAVAASVGCILVSFDVTTMPRHFVDFVARQPSPGLILIPASVSIGQAIGFFGSWRGTPRSRKWWIGWFGCQGVSVAILKP
jgi:hypothetical protein